MSRATESLRALLMRDGVDVLLEAHDTVSAQLAQEAGVPGVWASSLSISCARGYRDDNTLSMSEVLCILESMTDRLHIPVLFDGDTGYGSFAHTELLVKRLCARGVAGVCIEDKRLPKRNSFVRSHQQRLEDPEVFVGKIKAAKDAQTDPAFVVVARTEAMIVGLEVDDALERAARYEEAGADALLIHSKDTTFDRMALFLERYQGDVPIVVVPTTYADTPPARMAEAGVSVCIWANHMLRASIHAMRLVAAHVATHGTVAGAHVPMVPVQELFRLQDVEGLLEHEARYGGLRAQGGDDD